MEALKAEGVEHVFGIPGGANLPTYDAIYDADLTHIQARHEQGAGHMAEGYAKASGKVGVAMATSGPGATNLVTAIADAIMDSVPTVFITGQVRTELIGTDGFQEADVSGITLPIVKHSMMVTDPRHIPEYIHQAFHIASTGRPGPVLVDVPQDLSRADIEYEPSTEPVELPGYKPSTEGNIKQIRIAAKALANSIRPVIYAGGGVINANASEELREFCLSDNFPVTCTVMGLGGLPGASRAVAGHAGDARHPHRQLRDGRGRPDRLRGRPLRRPHHRQAQRVRPARQVRPHRHRPGRDLQERAGAHPDRRRRQAGAAEADQGVPGDQGRLLAAGRMVASSCASGSSDYPLGYERSEQGEIKPQAMVEAMYKATEGDAIITSDVGQHQMWAAQYYHFDKPRRWINSGGLGTMGFGLPSAIGAKVACPDDSVVCLAGDGSLIMTCQELATAVRHEIPVKVFLMNNGYFGMVRQWQELFWDGRYSSVEMGPSPDWLKLADAFGAKGMRVDDAGEVEGAMRDALAAEGPVLLDVQVTKEENCYPMIPAGSAARDMVGGPEPEGADKKSKETA